MLVIEHHNNKIVKVLFDNEIDQEFTNQNIVTSLIPIAKKYPKNIVIWCQTDALPYINSSEIHTLIDSERKFISYNPTSNFFSDSIGYVEESPFININKEVSYPTWQMSSLVGATSANTILKFDPQFFKIEDFDYFLCSIAKHYMPLGLFCYSEPRLLTKKNNFESKKASSKQLFQFIAQHYKPIWKFLLFLNLLLYQKKLSVIPLFSSLVSKKLFYSRELELENKVDTISIFNEEIDVIIPTIGRKQYLYDFLCDLNHQKHLPKNVIIVEQNPQANTSSELDYLNEKWNFTIKHIFTHQTGACNARNEAIKLIKSKWIFFADDDIRIRENFIEQALKKTTANKIDALVFKCLNPNENEDKDNSNIAQTTIFGSGSSIVKLKETIYFNTKLEFGYGEDLEYGLQLRQNGIDVFYSNSPSITHLKAPIGGFRYKHNFYWDTNKIKPLPSPTVLFYKKKYYTKQQVLGYKTTLFFNLLKNKVVLKKIFFLTEFIKSWNYSNYWANQLENEN